MRSALTTECSHSKSAQTSKDLRLSPLMTVENEELLFNPQFGLG